MAKDPHTSKVDAERYTFDLLYASHRNHLRRLSQGSTQLDQWANPKQTRLLDLVLRGSGVSA
jgi:hypothetical protein